MIQYQLLPDLAEEEFAALKADIAKRGVQVPVEKDERGNVLDGHHRLRACHELGVTDYPTIIRPGMSEEEKTEHILALNLDRRHLTREQRKELVDKLRQQGYSGRRIAERLGVSEGTVRNYTGAQNYAPEFVTGQDGKSYPAHRAPAPISEADDGEEVEEFSLPDDWEVDARREYIARERAEWEAERAPLPHVAQNSGDNEWYTPAEYIEAARAVMGGIDLDPASTATANSVVQAEGFFTAEEDGLQQEWHGRVWMNPPYAQPLIQEFAEKLIADLPRLEQATVLVNNATETRWFQALGAAAAAICFPQGRVRFWAPDKVSAPLQGQAILYFGERVAEFREAFAPFGLVMLQ